LKPLEYLTKLKRLHIKNTDIDSGVEYLPNNIHQIHCSSEERPSSKVAKISEQLEKRFNIDGYSIQGALDKLLPKSIKEQVKQIIIKKYKGKEPVFVIDSSYVNFPPLKKINGGKLDLSEYPNLETIIIDGDYLKTPLTKLELGQKPKLSHLSCSKNRLSEIDLSGSKELTIFTCSDNQFTSLDLKNNSKLGFLDCGNNNFSEQDLSFLSKLTNLQFLLLGSDNEEKIEQGIYNRFHGSLESLQKMSKLQLLDVSNTDIDNGVEYLPSNIEILYCSAHNRKEAKVQAIFNLFTDEYSIVNFPQKLQP